MNERGQSTGYWRDSVQFNACLNILQYHNTECKDFRELVHNPKELNTQLSEKDGIKSPAKSKLPKISSEYIIIVDFRP